MKDSLGMQRKKLSMTCPKCRRKFQESVARLDDKKQLRCPHCKMLFDISKLGVTRAVEKELDAFKRSLRKFGKRP